MTPTFISKISRLFGIVNIYPNIRMALCAPATDCKEKTSLPHFIVKGLLKIVKKIGRLTLLSHFTIEGTLIQCIHYYDVRDTCARVKEMRIKNEAESPLGLF